MDASSLTLPLAYLLDLGLGDPRWLPHPVRGLGWVIHKAESAFRTWMRNEILAGWLLVLGIALGSFGLVEGVLVGASHLSVGLARGVEVVLLFFCLSTRDLAVESRLVYRALQSGNLTQARAKVAMIVGRDTDSLTEPEVVRATVETIGESTMDGIVAPLFYAVAGGVPLACLYKAVNTLDSMVGYRSVRYLKFGRASALADSWMNALPARVTAFLIAVAASITGFSGWGSLRVLFRDAWERGENSLLPEAAMAGALRVQLGGVNFYQGKALEVPRLGDPNRPLIAACIPQAIRLMVATSLLGFVVALLVRWGLGGSAW